MTDKIALLERTIKNTNAKLKAYQHRLAREQARQVNAEAENSLSRIVHAGYVAGIVRGHISMAERVQLDLRPSSGGYAYSSLELTGDPEIDRWKGCGSDYTGPRFIRPTAIKRFNRLVSELKKLIEKNRVLPE